MYTFKDFKIHGDLRTLQQRRGHHNFTWDESKRRRLSGVWHGKRQQLHEEFVSRLCIGFIGQMATHQSR